jgi:hypothetical protein
LFNDWSFGTAQLPKGPVSIVSGYRITRLQQAGRAGGDPAFQNVFLVGGQRRAFRHLVAFHKLP